MLMIAMSLVRRSQRSCFRVLSRKRFPSVLLWTGFVSHNALSSGLVLMYRRISVAIALDMEEFMH